MGSGGGFGSGVDEAGAAVGGVELAVGEEAAFGGGRAATVRERPHRVAHKRSLSVAALLRGPGPLNAAGFVEHLVIADAGDVAGGLARELFEDLERGFGRGPAREHFAAAPVLGDEFEDVEIGERLAGGAADFFGEADAALGIDHGAFLFAPAGGGQVKVGEAGGFGRGIHVLHDEEIEFVESSGGEVALMDPGMGGVRGDDPEAADFAGVDAVDDLVVGPDWLVVGMTRFGNVEDARRLCRGGRRWRNHGRR